MTVRPAAVAAVLLRVADCSAGVLPRQASGPQSGSVTVTPDADGVPAVTVVTRDNSRFEFTVVPGRVRVTLDSPSGTVYSLRYDDDRGHRRC